jgi:hypothetical protein
MEHLPQQYRAGRVWNWKIGIEEPAIIPQGLDPAKVKYVISMPIKTKSAARN